MIKWDANPNIQVELDRILFADPNHGPFLDHDEMTTVRRNIGTLGMDVDNELIRETWHPVFRRNFLRASLGRCSDCRRGFWMYKQGKSRWRDDCTLKY